MLSDLLTGDLNSVRNLIILMDCFGLSVSVVKHFGAIDKYDVIDGVLCSTPQSLADAH